MSVSMFLNFLGRFCCGLVDGSHFQDLQTLACCRLRDSGESAIREKEHGRCHRPLFPRFCASCFRVLFLIFTPFLLSECECVLGSSNWATKKHGLLSLCYVKFIRSFIRCGEHYILKLVTSQSGW